MSANSIIVKLIKGRKNNLLGYFTVALFPVLLQPSYPVKAQDLLVSSPLLSFKGNQVVSIERTIKNIDKKPVSFSFSDMYQTEAAFIKNITATVATISDRDKKREQLVFAVADYLKSKRFKNYLLIFEGSEQNRSLWQKEMSLVGLSHSIYSTQCGNMFNQAATLLMKTGFFNASDFEKVSVPGHTFGQIKLKGRFAIADFDAATIGFMHKDSINGQWASIEDIRANPNLLQAYHKANELDAAPMEEYKMLLSGNPIVKSPIAFAADIQDRNPVSSTFTIPANATVTASTGKVFLLDLSNEKIIDTVEMASSYVDSFKNGNCPKCMDKAISVVMQVWNVDSTIAKDIFNGTQTIGYYNSITSANKPLEQALNISYFTQVPRWQLDFENTDTILVGRDLKAPLILLSSTGSGSYCIGDNCAESGTRDYNIWDNNPHVINNNELNYLQSGIMSAGKWKLNVAVNTNLISHYGEWKLATQQPDLLEINTEVKFH